VGKYVEIKLSFSDKMKLLFFDLIPEGILNSGESNINYRSQPVNNVQKDSFEPVIIKEEVIPFFDNVDDVESNF